jgi:hypothetical protein
VENAPKTLDLSGYPYRGGVTELQLGVGAFASGGSNRATINYATEYVRLGRMFSDTHCRGLLRGNFEGLVEIFGDEVFTGPGTGLLGATLKGRYNFVQEQARLVPYLQVGGGGLANDVYRDRCQRVIGSGFEFILQVGAGCRWSLNSRNALFAEFEYQHISNANTASRNVGLNGFGGSVGFSHFF